MKNSQTIWRLRRGQNRLGAWGLAVLLCSLLSACETIGQTLTDLLKGYERTYTNSPAQLPETEAVYAQLIDAANGSDLDLTRKLAEKFQASPGFSEPQQKELAETILKIFSTPGAGLKSEQRQSIDREQGAAQTKKNELQSKINQTKADLTKVEEEVKRLEASIAEKEKSKMFKEIGKAVLDIFLSAEAREARKRFSEALNQDRHALEAGRSRRSTLQTDLASYEKEMTNVESNLRRLSAESELLGRQLNVALRDEIEQRIEGLTRIGYPREAQALANHYTRVAGADPKITAVGDRAMKQIEKLKRAELIAVQIDKEVRPFLQNSRPWKASELLVEKAKQVDESLIGNTELLDLVGKKLANLAREAERMKAAAVAVRDRLFQLAVQNSKVLQDFEQWLSDHPDYPATLAEKDRANLFTIKFEEDKKAILELAKARPLDAYDKAQLILKDLDPRAKLVIENQLMSLLDLLSANAVQEMKKRLNELLQPETQLAGVDGGKPKEVVESRIRGEKDTLFFLAEAWLKRPIPDIMAAELRGLTNQLFQPRLQTPIPSSGPNWLDLAKQNGPVVLGVGLVGCWLLFARRSPKVASNR